MNGLTGAALEIFGQHELGGGLVCEIAHLLGPLRRGSQNQKDSSLLGPVAPKTRTRFRRDFFFVPKRVRLSPSSSGGENA